jgi:uncharacterized Ntn-hydrolase superfamily protein
MTFSIAGFCRRTGAFGCAMATSSMAAGARVPFVGPGLGVVLTQARTDARLGYRGLELLREGNDAARAIAALVAGTPHAPWRQLAIIDTAGGIADFTGAEVMAPKGARRGADGIAIGNAVASEAVLDAMLAGFAASPDELLADRLLAGLAAGLGAGGEGYPLRSAALKLAEPGIPILPVDLRIDFDEAPVAALTAHWRLWAPMAAGYVQRALDPAAAPLAETIEGHARQR